MPLFHRTTLGEFLEGRFSKGSSQWKGIGAAPFLGESCAEDSDSSSADFP
jgi:hypothetical protein